MAPTEESGECAAHTRLALTGRLAVPDMNEGRGEEMHVVENIDCQARSYTKADDGSEMEYGGMFLCTISNDSVV